MPGRSPGILQYWRAVCTAIVPRWECFRVYSNLMFLCLFWRLIFVWKILQRTIRTCKLNHAFLVCDCLNDCLMHFNSVRVDLVPENIVLSSTFCYQTKCKIVFFDKHILIQSRILLLNDHMESPKGPVYMIHTFMAIYDSCYWFACILILFLQYHDK